MILVLGWLWLLAIGVPLFALFGAASLGLFLDGGSSWEAAAIDVFGAKLGDSPSLMTLPLLTFTGCLLARTQAPQRLLALGRAWLGWMPRPLAAATWLAATLLTTLQGGVATAASAALCLPSLLRASAHAVSVDGTRPGWSATPFATAPAWSALRAAAWELTIPLMLIAAPALGAVRLHETAALTALYALGLAVGLRRELHPARDLPPVATETVTVAGAVLAVVATAIGLDAWLLQADVLGKLLAWLDHALPSRVAFVLVTNAALFALSLRTGAFCAVLLCVPLLLPLADHYQLDPYALAVVFALNATLARFIAPPAAPLEPRPA